MPVGAKLAELNVEIKADKKPLDADLASTKTKLGAFAKSAAIKIGVSIAGIAGAAGLAGIGAKLFEATKKASALGETLSKVKTTFGPAAAGVIDQADDLATKFGVVRREALDASAAFGLMAQAAGLSKSASAAVGSEFVKLGVDIASFHNLSNAEAFEKLRSGLAGESEPLRPLGILLSEDAVKAEALAIGLTKTVRQLNDQEKVMARLSLIRRQAGPAVGDKERTMDSAENQLKKAQGDLENFQTEMGEKLIPALISAIGLANDLGAAFAKAFGTSAVDGFANSLKSTIDAARAAIGPEAGRFIVGAGAASLTNTGALGENSKFAVQRDLQRMAANAMGAPLSAPGIPSMMTGPGADQKAIAADQDAKQRKLIADADAKHKQWLADEKQGADFIANARLKRLKEETDEAVKGFGRGLAAQIGAALQGKAAPVLGAGGMLLQGAAQLGQNIAKAAAKEKPVFHAQQFSDIADYSRSLIEASLNKPGEDKAAQQLEALNQAKDKLEVIKEGIGKIVANIGKPLALIPR